MATINFKATEDDRPGGGVYRIPGSGSTWKIKQSDYPNVNLASMTANNFFAAARCHTGNYASVEVTEDQNIGYSYSGGNAGRLTYVYSGGIGTVSIAGAVNRQAKIKKYLGSYAEAISTSGMSYTLYMSRNPIQ